jgi:hypothetical protein
MIRSLAILAMSLWACTAGQAQTTNEELHLRATVQAVVLLSSFSGRIIPVDFDPRFAVTMRIESAVPEITNFSAGAIVTFAIHSPSLTFGEKPTEGNSFDVVVHRKVEDGKVRFFGFKVRKVQAHKSDAPNR